MENINKKIEKEIGNEIEGVVIRNIETGEQIKLVDKEIYTANLKKHWEFVDKISNKTIKMENGTSCIGIEKVFLSEIESLVLNNFDININTLKKELKNMDRDAKILNIQEKINNISNEFFSEIGSIINK
jgi:hypothetical protein